MASEHPINDPSHWRQRAEQMRKLAGEAKDAETKRIMMKVAADYERLAIRAEQRSKGEKA